MKTITRIDAVSTGTFAPALRVAAYCRVSTDSDAQMESLDAQKTHYDTFIRTKPGWMFSGIYYDEGLTATKKSNRP